MTEEEKAAIRQSLLDWRGRGVANPTIPAFDDFDSDGFLDFYGLDANDQLVTVPGAPLEASVFMVDNQSGVNGE